MIHLNKALLKSTFFFCLLLTCNSASAFSNWWECSSKKGGEWNFGRTPSTCLVDHMLTQSSVITNFEPIVFQDQDDRTKERERYMTELNALAQEVVIYYFAKRKPQASSNEREAFLLGMKALMNQETFWTHFRKHTDGKIRYMRGDYGHGHGIMQVDDRSHQSALLAGKGADLIHNMVYGLDVYFAAWERAPSQFCVSSSTDYYARIRSAWSAYNGGPSRICRWTDSGNSHAAKDKAFKSKLDKKRWQDFILNSALRTKLDVECLAEGTRPCSGNSPTPPISQPIENVLYRTSANNYCVFKSQNYQCVELLDDVNCLQLRENKTYPGSQSIPDNVLALYPIQKLDRHLLCGQNVKGLIAVSQNIQLLKNINLRKTPGGELLRTLSKGTEYSNMDFRVQSTSDQKRYYKVSHNGQSGYVYAGDKSDYSQWVNLAQSPEPTSPIAQNGEFIRIVAPFGINLRKTPGGSFKGFIFNGEEVEVLGSVVRGSKNYLYYHVASGIGPGYIYSGYLDEPGTTQEWTEIISSDETYFKLSNKVPYRFLRTCPSNTCAYNSHALLSDLVPGKTDKVIVLSTQGEWSQVQSYIGGKTGWIETSYLTRVQ